MAVGATTDHRDITTDCPDEGPGGRAPGGGRGGHEACGAHRVERVELLRGVGARDLRHVGADVLGHARELGGGRFAQALAATAALIAPVYADVAPTLLGVSVVLLAAVLALGDPRRAGGTP